MLTDLEMRALEAKAAPYKNADALRLCLQIMPSGSKLWRWKFRHLGAEKRLSMGRYPDVTLAAVRHQPRRCGEQPMAHRKFRGS
jgi:hypothetical protein